jgi:uncharacterized membrane protein
MLETLPPLNEAAYNLLLDHFERSRELAPYIASQLGRTFFIYFGKSFIIIALRKNGIVESIVVNSVEGLIGGSFNPFSFCIGLINKNRISIKLQHKLLLASLLPAAIIAIIPTVLAFTVATENDTKISLFLEALLSLVIGPNKAVSGINFSLGKPILIALLGLLTRGIPLFSWGFLTILLENIGINITLPYTMAAKIGIVAFNTFCYYLANCCIIRKNKPAESDTTQKNRLDIAYFLQIFLPTLFNVLVSIIFSRMSSEYKDPYGFLTLILTTFIRILNSMVFGGLKYFEDKDINNVVNRIKFAKNFRVFCINMMIFSSIVIFPISYLCGNVPWVFRIIMGDNYMSEDLKANLKSMSMIMSQLCMWATLRQIFYGMARKLAGNSFLSRLYLSGSELLAFGGGVFALYSNWFKFDSQYEPMPVLYAYLTYLTASNFIHSGFVLWQLFFNNTINKIIDGVKQLLGYKPSNNRYRFFPEKKETIEENPIQRNTEKTWLNKVEKFARRNKNICGVTAFYRAFKWGYECFYPEPDHPVAVSSVKWGYECFYPEPDHPVAVSSDGREIKILGLE